MLTTLLDRPWEKEVMRPFHMLRVSSVMLEAVARRGSRQYWSLSFQKGQYLEE
jgi:hypothetical protein